MICGGDEIGRTQEGNNNGYCQDNPLTWLNWDLTDDDAEFLQFAQFIGQLRNRHPSFRRHSFAELNPETPSEAKSLEWLRADGACMDEADWQEPWIQSMGLYLYGLAPEIRNPLGELTPDDDFLLLFNAHYNSVAFEIPEHLPRDWSLVFTTWEAVADSAEEPTIEFPYWMEGRSLTLLRHRR